LYEESDFANSHCSTMRRARALDFAEQTVHGKRSPLARMKLDNAARSRAVRSRDKPNGRTDLTAGVARLGASREIAGDRDSAATEG